MAIRNPAPHDHFQSRVKADVVDHYQEWDVRHAREKFPNADAGIVERLGRASARRRHYLKYREEHTQKIAEGVDPVVRVGASEGEEREKATTIASSIPSHLKEGRIGAESTTQLAGFSDSESIMSMTSYAASTTNSSLLRVPPLPKESEAGPFKCPFCCMIVSIKTRRDWKKHVFRDLRPYVCIYPSCTKPDQQYQRRADWIDHMKQDHWRSWLCPFGCLGDFASPRGFGDHIEEHHSTEIQAQNIDALQTLASNSDLSKVKGECPLCLGFRVTSERQYGSHVGTHLEQLSLFALPHTGDQDDESNDGSDDESGREIPKKDADESSESDLSVDQGVKSPPNIPHVGSSEGSHGDGDYSKEGAPEPTSELDPNEDFQSLTQEERISVDRLEGLGYSHGEVLQAFLQSGRNEQDAADLLFKQLDPDKVHHYNIILRSLTKAERSSIETLKEYGYSEIDVIRAFLQSDRNEEVAAGVLFEHFPYVEHDAQGQFTGDDIPVKCICNSPDDDGNALCCETCVTLQHIKCYYPGRIEEANRDDFHHACVDCEPRASVRALPVEPQEAKVGSRYVEPLDAADQSQSEGEELPGEEGEIVARSVQDISGGRSDRGQVKGKDREREENEDEAKEGIRIKATKGSLSGISAELTADSRKRKLQEWRKSAKPPQLSDEAMYRIIQEMEEEDARYEKKQAEIIAKKRAATEEAKKLAGANKKKTVADADEELRRQEREMERLEEEKNASRKAKESTDAARRQLQEWQQSILDKGKEREQTRDREEGVDQVTIPQSSGTGSPKDVKTRLDEIELRFAEFEASHAEVILNWTLNGEDSGLESRRSVILQAAERIRHRLVAISTEDKELENRKEKMIGRAKNLEEMIRQSLFLKGEMGPEQ